MATFHAKSFGELETLIRRHHKARLKRARKAVERTARLGKTHIIQHTLPIAFRTLEKSVHVEISQDRIAIVADAPHAEAVENGSRPHVVPLKALIEWVTLRGMQGLHNETHAGKFRKTRGTTTTQHAEEVLSQLRTIAAVDPEAVAVIEVAKAIQNKIAKRGTKPQKFMFSAMPEIEELLDREIRMSLEDKAEQSTPFAAAAE